MNRWRGISLREHCVQYWTAYAVLLISLSATSLVYRASQDEISKRQLASFEQASSKFRNSMELHLASYLRVLNGLAAFFVQDPLPGTAQFRQFLNAQGIRTNHPGMYDMGYVASIRGRDQSAWETYAHTQGVVEENISRLPHDQQDHYVLMQWDDFTVHDDSAVGSHIFIESNRVATMNKARDLGEIVCTDKVEIHTGNQNVVPNGFILYAPVYRADAPLSSITERQQAIKGFAFASFFVTDFGNAVFQAAGEPMIDFDIYQGPKVVPEKLWHDSNTKVHGPRRSKAHPPSRFESSLPLKCMGQDWTLHCSSLPEFENSPEVQIPSWILLAGFAVSSALFLLTLNQAQARIRTESLARDLRLTTNSMSEEKERLSVTLSSIMEGVIAVDTSGLIVLLNRVAEKMMGHSLRHAHGKPLENFFVLEEPVILKRVSDRVQEVLRTGIAWQTPHPVILRSHDGANPPVLITISAMRDAGGGIHGAVVVFRDVSERQKLLEEQMKSGKIESIGVLAGGIAHDFNNILTAILGNISIATISSDHAERSQCLLEAEQACGRARDLTQQLLTFAKGGAPVRKTAILSDAIRESARFASHGSTARCECRLPEDMWPVEADIGQIGQVIHNMVINAVQAMSEGGMIEITGQNLTLKSANELNLEAGRYVKITIQDQGSGIAREHLSKIFDPYFTTKSRGTGLGLATSYSIVKRHDGVIAVDSKQGKGTRFDIYLPASDRFPAAVAPLAASPVTAPVVVGKKRVLVMDDEPPVLMLLDKMLKKLGYETITAYEGAEAVRLFSAAKNQNVPIDVVILDLTVPGGVGGRQALKQLLSIDPGVKAIVSSGYSSDWVMSNFQDHGFQAVVSKPYSIETLANALNQVLLNPTEIEDGIVEA